MLIWETIPQDQAGYLSRAKIFGGWLVKEAHDVHLTIPDTNVLGNHGYEWTSSITFVPDPKHEWEINK